MLLAISMITFLQAKKRLLISVTNFLIESTIYEAQHTYFINNIGEKTSLKIDCNRLDTLIFEKSFVGKCHFNKIKINVG